mmetsp:Transcript_19394/g.39253  ORF Transcript_19394/g.39253 Transcript_19394/m.39253 type:complete len:186 (+) Transcript_19394:494-1051(+)
MYGMPVKLVAAAVVIVVLVFLLIIPIAVAVIVAAITIIAVIVPSTAVIIVIRVIPPAPVAFLAVVITVVPRPISAVAIAITAAVTVAAIITSPTAVTSTRPGPGARGGALPAGTTFIFVVCLDAGGRVVMSSSTPGPNPAPIEFSDCIIRIAGRVKLKNAFSVAHIGVARRRAAVFTSEIFQILP